VPAIKKPRKARVKTNKCEPISTRNGGVLYLITLPCGKKIITKEISIQEQFSATAPPVLRRSNAVNQFNQPNFTVPLFNTPPSPSLEEPHVMDPNVGRPLKWTSNGTLVEPTPLQRPDTPRPLAPKYTPTSSYVAPALSGEDSDLEDYGEMPPFSPPSP